MSNYNFTLTMENVRAITVMFLDILAMWFLLYYAIQLIRKSRKTVQIFKGILIVLVVDWAARFLGMRTLEYFADIFVNWGFLAVIIIFQEEIRGLLEGLGKSNVLSRISTLTGDEKENLVDQIVTATMLLSQDQTGALICIEQSHSLDDFIATGTPLNSDVSAELLTSIFVTSTPLHDGAVIIQGDKIACASAYFPPTNLDLPNRYGARHRAAIGISEITDAVTIVVSEETGAVSIAEGGVLTTVNKTQLRNHLLRVICGTETEVTSNRSTRKAAQEDARPRAVIIEDEKPAKTVKPAARKDGSDEQKTSGNTGLLKKLAVRHQDEETAPSGRIQAEEVVVPEGQETEKIEELEQEASEIKLPHKKKRPKPSYPDNAQVRRFEQERKEEEERQQRLKEEAKQRVEAEAKAAEEERARKAAAEARAKAEAEAKAKAEAEAKAKAEAEETARQAAEHKRQEQAAAAEETVAPVRPMTAEDVRRARQEALDRLTGRKTVREEEKKPEETKPAEKAQDGFDTDGVDLSKLVGFKEDLDKTMTMIDGLSSVSDDSDKTKGDEK